MSLLTAIIDYLLFGSCIFLLLGSLYLTFKTDWVQIRFLSFLFRSLRRPSSVEKKPKTPHTIAPYKALFTSMSTTMGISTIVGPVIAVRLGGAGALFGFLLTAFFGSAATYAEVNLSIRYRKKTEDGKVMGGPMQYLREIFSPKAARLYAIGCMLLMTVWSAAQANQLAAVLNAPAFGSCRVSPVYSGMAIAALVFIALKGGIRWIGNFSAKLVPVMFILYIGSSLWILVSSPAALMNAFQEMFQSLLAPRALAGGVMVGGVVTALRWGVFKGVQATEAGVGTQAIPHSMAETTDARAQGALSMVSTFAAGGVAFLSGCVALVTQTWQDPSLPLGIGMVAASYERYFSFAGVVIVAVCAFLFAFGTILGNSFNGSQCYDYLSKNGKSGYYSLAMVGMIFLGAIGEVTAVWSLVDVVLACMAIPHMFALILSVHRRPDLFVLERKVERTPESV